MRSSASSHHLSYRTKVSSQHGGSKCLTLNCKSILSLLNVLNEDSSQAASSTAVGQKRPRPLSHIVSRKRRVFGIEQSVASCPPNENIPVLHHEFDLQYSKERQEVYPYVQPISDNDAEEHGLISSEESLVDFLRNVYASPSEPITLDCGDVLINSYGEYGGTVDVKPSHPNEQWAELCGIFVVPFLNAESIETGGHLFSWVDALTRSSPRQPAVEVTAGFRMVVSPLTSWDETLHTLPFHLVVDVVLSFLPPSIFRPLSPIEIENARRGLLHLAFPPPSLAETFSTSFHGRIDVPFLYAVVQPAKALPHESIDKFLQPQVLLPQLLPFQRRTVCWMLSREEKAFGPTGELAPIVTDVAELPVLWRRVTVQRDGEQMTWYYHRLSGTLTPERPSSRTILGGILAEEPGLGKTLECIALILLNPSIERSVSHARWDSESNLNIREIRTTLIVTPSSLSQQWIDELTRHAPSLKVLAYPGWKSLLVKQEKKGKNKTKEVDVTDTNDTKVSLFDNWPAYINDFDVCVTTYDTLRQDLAVARAAPSRPVRQMVEYARHRRPISPLVICEWYRVIMDEVQMVGGGKASEMVSLIPRLSSFAVSGTPAKTRVSDLHYVLKFLRVDPSIYTSRNWNRLVQPSYVTEFTEVFQQYCVRTMKLAVQAELTIPLQMRYVFPIHLGRVERHVYDETLEKALLHLGLDARGVATTQNGEVDTALLRTWLRKLRQICTHPQVGQLQKSGDKLSKSGVLKTMRQVLEGMKDQNWRNVMDDRCSKINEMVKATQILQHDVGIDQRPQKCLEILLQAERESDEVILDVLSAITDHDAKGIELKAEAASLRAERGIRRNNGPRDDRFSTVDDESDNESDDDELPKTPAGDEHLHKSRVLQQRLRDCYLTLHKVKFIQGDMYHWMGESKAVEEELAYKAADEIRHKILKFTEESAVRAMAQLRADVGKKGLVKKDILVKLPYCPRGGILSAYLLEEADELIDQVLNAQSHLLWEWRTHIYSLLARSLTANNDGGVDGQEYSRTLDTQGEAETYLQAYAMLIADRREVLTAERSVLAVHDAREHKHRKTTAAAKAITLESDEPDLGLVTEGVELQPEYEVLKTKLIDARKTLLMNVAGRAVKSIVVDLTAVAAKITKEHDPEKILAKEGVSTLRRLMSAQAIINEQIEADLALFRKAFNERILYFRQLQEISDSVGEAQWDDVDVGLALQRARDAQTLLDRRIATGRAKQRYLTHLSEEQDLGRGEANRCILCEGEFLRGYITQCAHAFCETCMEMMLLRHGKACPVCRFPIRVDALQRFSIQTKDKDRAVPPPEKLQGDAIPKSRRKIEYNTVGPSLLAEIDTMELCGSYGTKIDTLVRHLQYLQVTEPGAKSIVFSAWEDSLHIIEHALARNDIPSIRIDSGNRKQNSATRFRNDPNILVLLLHGERQNAGLNVTCASRVFLLESVVHHSFEVQAIARIDRLGQLRPTEVYCYYAEDTVERNILDLAVRQGLSLYTTDRARGTIDTTVLAAPAGGQPIVDAPAKKKLQKGDFIFRQDDMMSILFPHLCEDVEFLLPPDEDVQMMIWDRSTAVTVPAAAGASSHATTPSRSSRRVHENAVAGPSRLG